MVSCTFLFLYNAWFDPWLMIQLLQFSLYLSEVVARISLLGFVFIFWFFFFTGFLFIWSWVRLLRGYNCFGLVHLNPYDSCLCFHLSNQNNIIVNGFLQHILASAPNLWYPNSFGLASNLQLLSWPLTLFRHTILGALVGKPEACRNPPPDACRNPCILILTKMIESLQLAA